jgi:molybdopterin converting factor small subunit
MFKFPKLFTPVLDKISSKRRILISSIFFKEYSMAKVHFTANLQRHLAVPSLEIQGETLAGVFQAMFEQYPNLRGYITNDQGHIRKHVTVFVNGEAWLERSQLNKSIPENCEIYVMQALSGG